MGGNVPLGYDADERRLVINPAEAETVRRIFALYRELGCVRFLDIIAEGQGDINGAMQSPPAGLWGLPTEILVTLPGYGPDVAANRAEARKLMEKHGYGPDHRLAVKGRDPQHCAISRPGHHPDRPDEGYLH